MKAALIRILLLNSILFLALTLYPGTGFSQNSAKETYDTAMAVYLDAIEYGFTYGPDKSVPFHQKTDSIFRIALVQAQQEGNCELEALSCLYIGHSLRKIGAYSEAQTFYEDAIPLAAKCEDKLPLYKCYYGIALNLQTNLGLPVRARYYSKKASEISIGIEDPITHAGLLGLEVDYWSDLSAYLRAKKECETYLKYALTNELIYEQISAYVKLAGIESSLATSFQKRYFFEEAEKATDHSLKLRESVVEIAREKGYHFTYNLLQPGIYMAKNFKEVLTSRRETDLLLLELFEPYDYKSVVQPDAFLPGKSKIYQPHDSVKQTEILLSEISSEYFSEGSAPYVKYYYMGLKAESRGDYANAFTYLKKSALELERERERVLIVQDRSNFLTEKTVTYQKYIQYLLDKGEYEKGFIYLDKIRSRTLQETLNIRSLRMSSPQLYMELQSLIQIKELINYYHEERSSLEEGLEQVPYTLEEIDTKISQLNLKQDQLNDSLKQEGYFTVDANSDNLSPEELINETIMSPSESSIHLVVEFIRIDKELKILADQRLDLINPRRVGLQRKQVLDKKISELEKEYDLQINRIKEKDSGIDELLAPANLSFEKLAPVLENHDLISFEPIEGGLSLWHISKNGIRVKQVIFLQQALLAKSARLISSLKRPGRYQDQLKNAIHLFWYLIKPIEEYFTSENLIIIPHADSYHIPFETLFDPSDSTYLGHKYNISYAPSASLLLQMGKGNVKGEFLGGANPNPSIPGEEIFSQEVVRSAAHFPEKNQTLLTNGLTETTFKQIASDYNVIHLSSHGTYDQEIPLESYISLDADSLNDGKLKANELIGLDLRQVDLITLSACESGNVQLNNSNEIYGFTQACITAGANSLLLSNWEVDATSTADWMEAFYKAAQSMDLPAAAKEARCTVYGNPKFKDPYYWAGFKLIGY